jgi:GNAT superfamily N-acetyltransferase
MSCLPQYFFNFSTWTGKPGLYLEDLYVQASQRNLGAGKALFRALARIALERGCGRMDWSVLDVGLPQLPPGRSRIADPNHLQWNQPSIDFYEKKVGAMIMPEWQSVRLEGTEALEGLAKLA